MKNKPFDHLKIVSYYNKFDEQNRLKSHWGQIELVRTQEIIKRYLADPPQVILDVGGGPGVYSAWLAQLGYEIHLIDPVPHHIEKAKTLSNHQPNAPIASFSVGDARSMEFPNSSADTILLMGPLYHLIEKKDRSQVLNEAFRIIKKGGLLFTVAISRFASTIDGMIEGYYNDPEFRKIFLQDLKNGQHRNHTDNPLYFMDTFFHHPNELKEEIEEAGFIIKDIIGIECISYMLRNIEQIWENEVERNFLLNILRKLDTDPSLLGASPHIMCVAQKSNR